MLMVLTLPLAIAAALIQTRISPHAYQSRDSNSVPAPMAAAVRGLPNDFWADTVVGKRDFTEISPREIVPFKVFAPGGVVVDRSVDPGRMYVWDSGNNRILGIDLSACYDEDSPCDANIVIGQPSSGDYGACNLDSSFQTYPVRPPAAAATLCGVKEYTHTTLEDKSFSEMYVDQKGDLYVPDAYNNRILKYISPFTTDTIADEVWGQDDFTGNECNKTGNMYNHIYPNPTNSSICLQSDSDGNGVSFDSGGNMWVADGGNNRVLRFPKHFDGRVGKIANLVLGQPNFISRNRGNRMTDMNAPAGLGFGPDGSLYVSDKNNGRILVYSAPFTSGMAATRVLVDTLNNAFLQMDDQGRGVWALDFSGSGKMSLFDFNGTVVSYFTLPYHGGGSVGFDSQNNILVPMYEILNDVLRYTFGLPPERDRCAVHDGDITACNADPSCAYYLCSDRCWLEGTPLEIGCNIVPPGGGYNFSKSIFASGYNGYNLTSGKRLEHPSLTGVAVTDTQLIVADGRVLFWNNREQITDGQDPDGYVGADLITDIPNPGFSQAKADLDRRVWITRGSDVHVYQTPLTTRAAPITVITSPMATVDGASFAFQNVQGLAPTAHGEYLWLSDMANHRVFRIRQPLSDAPKVDIVLGQPNLTDTFCNQDPDDPRNTDPWGSPYRNNDRLDTFCYPQALSLDNNQNLFVSDHTVESAGNWRLLMFSKDLFPENNPIVFFDPPATKEFPREDLSKNNPYVHQVFEPAFNSQNVMVIGLNPYSGHRFLEYYLDPTRVNPQNPSDPEYAKPDGQFNDFYGWATAMTFDQRDNLYAYDSNRGQVRVYQTPFGPIPTPTPTPPGENGKLVITTTSLPIGIRFRRYRATVSGVEISPPRNTSLTLSALQLPDGLQMPPESCITSADREGNMSITCEISGKPSTAGTFSPLLILRDNHDKKTAKSLPLRIIRKP
jgi:hypothetical protein